MRGKLPRQQSRHVSWAFCVLFPSVLLHPSCMHRTESTAPVSAPSTRLVNPAFPYHTLLFFFCLLFALRLTLLIPVSSTYVKHAERAIAQSVPFFDSTECPFWLLICVSFVSMNHWDLLRSVLPSPLPFFGCHWLQLLQMFAHVLSPWNFTEPYVISCKVSKGYSVRTIPRPGRSPKTARETKSS